MIENKDTIAIINNFILTETWITFYQESILDLVFQLLFYRSSITEEGRLARLQEKSLDFQVLPNAGDTMFDQRESGVMHTTYDQETALYALIERGDVENMRQMLNSHAPIVIVAGHISDDPIRQMRYLGVCCVTLAIRAAIRGGLNEMDAFSRSDGYIMQIDRMSSSEEIVAYLERITLELTELVRKRAHRGCPAQIRKCLAYIDEHLHGTVRPEELTDLTGLSKDYLAKLFKKHVGKSMRDYIEEKKMEAALSMLRNQYDEKISLVSKLHRTLDGDGTQQFLCNGDIRLVTAESWTRMRLSNASTTA